MVPNILKEFEEEVDTLRRHGILVRHESVYHYYCIGAAEFVLPLCDTGMLPGGNLFDLNEVRSLSCVVVPFKHSHLMHWLDSPGGASDHESKY